jgi:hypothetical protein
VPSSALSGVLRCVSVFLWRSLYVKQNRMVVSHFGSGDRVCLHTLFVVLRACTRGYSYCELKIS